MAVLDRDRTEKHLKKKGFVKENGRHVEFVFYHEGKRTDLTTSLSHSGADLRDTLISNIARELHLSKDEFMEFARCTMSKDQYVRCMHERGLLD